MAAHEPAEAFAGTLEAVDCLRRYKLTGGKMLGVCSKGQTHNHRRKLMDRYSPWCNGGAKLPLMPLPLRLGIQGSLGCARIDLACVLRIASISIRGGERE